MIAGNAKFEDRWFRFCFRKPPKNWLWDTVIAAHVMDAREGTTSVKFQAMVLLGFPTYNDHIHSLLSDTGESRLNRIQQVSWADLFEYNALDSILEYHIAAKQMEIMGYEHQLG